MAMSSFAERPDFSRIRHDLRTPVNHILGYAEMLLEDDTLPSAFRDDVQRIHTGGRALLVLIKDYFDDEHFAQKRPDAHRMYHELRTPVNHIIGYTELLTELAEDRGLTHLHADLEKIGLAAATWLTLMEEYLLAPRAPRAETEPVALPPGVRYVVPSAAEAKAAPQIQGTLLVVDDDPSNRDMLTRRLTRMGHLVESAVSGAEALQKLRAGRFDAVFLDLVMPGLDGYQVLTRIKSDAALAEVRVIMLSALDQEQGVARCIEAGADDFLAKPFNSVFLRARLGACLEKKAMRDREHHYLAEIQAEREKSEHLLLNILPQSIAGRLKSGETMIADQFECATVLFADLVGFTPLSRTMEPLALVQLLNDIFSRFDELAAVLGLEKIKTIGDAYMVAAGVPLPRPDHAPAAATLALRMNTALRSINAARGTGLRLRTGLHSGPLAAGIIGRHKFAYDLWGDTVNTASRMESSAPLDTIHLSSATAALLGDSFRLEPRGKIAVKGLGEMETWTLVGVASR
jgi:adenylate cyclase